MDIRNSLAARVYTDGRLQAAPAGMENGLEDQLSDFVETFADVLNKGESTARSAMIGDADPHALVEALASAQMAVETVVTVRDKVVQAYQEILRMPV